MPALVLSGVALELGFVALSFRGLWLVLLWPALAFAIAGLAYVTGKAGLLGKSKGSFRWGSYLFLFPYLMLCSVLWHILRLTVREAPWHRVTPTLVVGRRLLRREFPANIASVVDLTSELSAVVPPSPGVAYLGLPLLDGAAPTPAALFAAIEAITRTPAPIYIHCAQGHGRTGLVTAALLLVHRMARDPDDAVARLKAVRPGIRLNRAQQRALRGFHDLLVVGTEMAQQTR